MGGLIKTGRRYKNPTLRCSRRKTCLADRNVKTEANPEVSIRDRLLFLINELPVLFLSVTFKTSTKNYFYFYFFAFYFLKVHLHHFSKIKSNKEKRSHKTVGINVFLTIFA
jgi:hypothetical protein